LGIYERYSDEAREEIVASIEQNSSLTSLSVVGFFVGMSYQRLRDVEKRNKQLWKEKMMAACVINSRGRVLVGGDCGRPLFPNEILLHILSFVHNSEILSRRQFIRIVNFASNKGTIGKDSVGFLQEVKEISF